jgi:ABC-type transport system substrate-binding protein
MSEWAVWRKALNGRKSQNTIHGVENATNPDITSILKKLEERYDFASPTSMCNIPELNEKYERMRKSLDKNEIARIMVEIYRYAYDNYLMVPICEIPDMIAASKRIPKWDPGVRRSDRNYYNLIRQR